MDGFASCPWQAAKVGDIFCHRSPATYVIDTQHFEAMKDGAIVPNSGHFIVELPSGAA